MQVHFSVSIRITLIKGQHNNFCETNKTSLSRLSPLIAPLVLTGPNPPPRPSPLHPCTPGSDRPESPDYFLTSSSTLGSDRPESPASLFTYMTTHGAQKPSPFSSSPSPRLLRHLPPLLARFALLQIILPSTSLLYDEEVSSSAC